ncbi:MAG: oligosaccharide flippase family protein [Candidatus Marinamargulisbacteria bacterium]
MKYFFNINFIYKKIFKSEFNQSVLKLVSGTGLAQLIGIAVSPIITRLYSPSDFGQFGLYLSMIAMLSVGVSGRYELAIMLPKSNRKASQLLALCLVLIVLFTGLLVLGICIYHILFADMKPIGKWLYILPIGVLLRGLYNTLTNWINRQKKYSALSIAVILQRIFISSTQLLVGFLIAASIWGLIAGQIMGVMVSVLFLGGLVVKTNNPFIKQWNFASIKKVAKEYKNFPQFSMASGWLNTVSLEVPVLLLSFYFDANEVGYYILAKQVVQLPLGIIGQGVGKVFFQQASVVKDNADQLMRLFFSTIKKLALIILLPMIFLFFAGKQTFVFIFGPQWFVTGQLIEVLVPIFFVQFIISPLSNVFGIRNKNQLGLILNAILIISRFLSLMIGVIWLKTFINVLILFSIVEVFFRLFQIYFTYYIIKRDV